MVTNSKEEPFRIDPDKRQVKLWGGLENRLEISLTEVHLDLFQMSRLPKFFFLYEKIGSVSEKLFYKRSLTSSMNHFGRPACQRHGVTRGYTGCSVNE